MVERALEHDVRLAHSDPGTGEREALEQRIGERGRQGLEEVVPPALGDLDDRGDDVSVVDGVLDPVARRRRLVLDLELEVDEEALVERIAGRFGCADCGASYHDQFNRPRAEGVCNMCGSTHFIRRPDDNEETVRRRMAEYRAKTAPILPYYEERGLVRRVDGIEPVDEVAAQIDAILDS